MNGLGPLIASLSHNFHLLTSTNVRLGSFWSIWSSAVLLLDIDIQFPRKIRTFIDYWTSTSDILKNIYFPTVVHNCKDNLPKIVFFLARFDLAFWKRPEKVKGKWIEMRVTLVAKGKKISLWSAPRVTGHTTHYKVQWEGGGGVHSIHLYILRRFEKTFLDFLGSRI